MKSSFARGKATSATTASAAATTGFHPDAYLTPEELMAEWAKRTRKEGPSITLETMANLYLSKHELIPEGIAKNEFDRIVHEECYIKHRRYDDLAAQIAKDDDHSRRITTDNIRSRAEHLRWEVVRMLEPILNEKAF